MTSSSAIAPPAEFAISGTAFASASPEALAKILDSLDLASLEQEHARLERATQQLVQSNKEIAEFIEQEQQDLVEFQKQQGSEATEAEEGFEPDPEFVLAIEENKVVIAKYERTCADLLKAIQRKRGIVVEEVKETEDGVEQAGADDGVYL
ncbi:hypothetical protein BG015_007472 [Linnemannia schmuckeri]|uniref:Uncharacterized protein n=1 Tax=Linnemannia schmuckeri TaxID=64567 RepID=A0A9P5S0M4_9FUNG|nr:hypothetical protein BG015_007472 [Linnemannia schmuckeri]